MFFYLYFEFVSKGQSETGLASYVIGTGTLDNEAISSFISMYV